MIAVKGAHTHCEDTNGPLLRTLEAIARAPHPPTQRVIHPLVEDQSETIHGSAGEF